MGGAIIGQTGARIAHPALLMVIMRASRSGAV
ncbi:hypothetical protein SAMN05444159_5730 [Bradyrhizobium lablabi]|uniref:Uncharacterized protein n=1 Tax=Bradyrhizobium lablabi TaxID=722472 RepID=A0A1M7A3J8_9BRAD|nr:hypothetical protein SAMN05444159_5730 [Bradyrhizobium lablabi]